MWEAIRANHRKSAVLIAALASVLILCGYAMGYALDPGFAPLGAIGALLVWLVMMLSAFAGGENILLAQAGAREVQKKDAPQVFNLVEEMTIAAGLTQPPRVFIVDDPSPNAFAVGLNEKRAAIAVNTGLLARLDRDELQGVIAHEIGHIANRDTLFMTLAGVTVGAVVMLADFYLRGLRHGGYRGRSRDSKNGGAALIMLAVALVLAILAPLLARLLYFACSRRREYLADASAAQFTRYPEGLASALEKISGAQPSDPRDVSRVLAPMYICAPHAAHDEQEGTLRRLFSTHPPARERINILRGMRSDASLIAYEKAYEGAHGNQSILGAASLRGIGPAPVRAAATVAPAEVNAQWRQAKNILHGLNATATLDCACGLRIKLPPGFDAPSVTCPRCGAAQKVPMIGTLAL